MARTAEDVEAAAFRAPEMAASGASVRVDCVEVVLLHYTMKPNHFGILHVDGGCLFISEYCAKYLLSIKCCIVFLYGLKGKIPLSLFEPLLNYAFGQTPATCWCTAVHFAE